MIEIPITTLVFSLVWIGSVCAIAYRSLARRREPLQTWEPIDYEAGR